MKSKLLMMTFFGLIISQFVFAQDKNVKRVNVTNAKILNEKINCNNNGINITVSGRTYYTYPTPSSSTVCNTPVVEFTGSGFHSGGGREGVLTYTFSRAITCATVSYCWVEPDDVGAITTDGGGVVTLSNACGANINGNVLTSNLIGGVGNVTVRVSSTTPFTRITLTNVGANSGWGQGNPCNFILNDCNTVPCSTPTIRIRPQSTGGVTDGGVSDTGVQDQSGNINKLKIIKNKERVFEDDVMDRNSNTASNSSCQNPGKFTFIVQGLGNPTNRTYTLTKNGQLFSSGNFNANSSNQLNNLDEGTYELSITWSENGRTCSAKESLNICKPIKFDNCTSCIPESLYSKDITKTLFSIIPVTATMDNFTYKLQFNSTQDFVNLNNNWNNWINSLVKPALGNLSRAQEIVCLKEGGFVQVVHEFRLYDITNGTEIEVPNSVFHIHSSTNYGNVNWQPQDHPFSAILDFNKKYMIKHGVYYESSCLKDNNVINELIKSCPWKESRLTTNRDIDKSNKSKVQKVYLE